MNKALKVYDDVEPLAKKLVGATLAYGVSDTTVSLAVVATAVTTLGAPRQLREMLAAHLARDEHVIETMKALWNIQIGTFRYLDPIMPPLLRWMDDPNEQTVKAARECWAVLAETDLHATIEGPTYQGDILGPLYAHVLPRSVVNARGVFYTPMSVSRMIADMNDIEEGKSINDPCCGSGGMTVAAVRSMRQRKRDPNTCTWYLNDVDPIACALAGVNMSAHGIFPVVVANMNALGPEYAASPFPAPPKTNAPAMVPDEDEPAAGAA